jgi:N-dimethylarginine dimethylaminohydrolase
MQSRPRFLMCAPRHYAVQYAINPWMDVSSSVDSERACAQWETLRIALSERADIFELEPAAGLPDMCFAANGGFVFGSVFVASHFLNDERRGEEKHYIDWFERRGFECAELPRNLVFEGAGDALLDSSGECVWMGHGQRSHEAAAVALAGALGIEVIALRLVNTRFYHLDTCFCPLPSGHLMYFPAAFDAPSRCAIEKHYPPDKRIAVSEKDAHAFACNAIGVGDTVICPAASVPLLLRLNEAGLRVLQIDVGEFLKAGGAAKCLVLALDKPPACRLAVRGPKLERHFAGTE